MQNAWKYADIENDKKNPKKWSFPFDSGAGYPTEPLAT